MSGILRALDLGLFNNFGKELVLEWLWAVENWLEVLLITFKKHLTLRYFFQTKISGRQ